MHTPAEQDAFGRAERRSHIEALVKKAIAGDVRAMEDLLACFQPLLAKLSREAMQRLPRAEREEVEMEVRCLFLSALCEFDEKRGVPFIAYVTQRLSHRMRHFVRHELRHSLRQVYLSELGGEEGGAVWDWLLLDSESGEAFEGAMLRLWLDQVLRQLSEQQRRVLTLTFEGFFEREIASRLGLSGPGVHKLKKTALARLQECWDEPPQDSAA